MSYELERMALTNFIEANSFFGLNPFGLDSSEYSASVNSGYMEIISGQTVKRSISTPNVLISTPSILLLTFYLEGGKGSSEARIKAQEIIDVFFERQLDENGTSPTANSLMIIDFGATVSAPYISFLGNEAPHLRTTVTASFVRTERKTRV